ncbi:MAG: RidA family protein [Deltaproteobacteria bacterium]|nr:RidA family protein [Deltaproteobacteria bacterium]
MAIKIEHIEWPDRPDVMMPYAPAIKVSGGALVFIAGVTAAPVYHSHPHIPEEFADIPLDMESQAKLTMENLKKSLDSVGTTFANMVVANRFLTDLSQQDILNKVWNSYVGQYKPTTTTVQIVQLATDPRCLVEINAIAVVD